MQSFDFKKFRPHLLIIAGFAVLALIYSFPALKGMVLQQHDTISWVAMSQEAREWHEKTGENTLWSNSMFGGMPTYLTYVPESNNFIYPVQKMIASLLVKPAYFFFIAMLGFYILMSTLRVNRWLAAAGAVAFAFSTYNPIIIVAGHETKMVSIAYMPMVIAGLLLTYRGRYLGGGTLLALSMALLISNSHYQIVFYTGIIILFIVAGQFVHALKQKSLRQFFLASAVSLAAAVISAGPSAGALMTTVGDLNKHTMRGGKSELTLNKDPNKKSGLDKDYAFQWSNGVGELFCVIVPYLYGGSSGESGDKAPETSAAVGVEEGLPLYWGPQPFISGPVYFGAVICFLFVLGMIVIRNPIKWWLLGASMLAALLSCGKHIPGFNYWFFDNIPFYNAFRTPSMALVIPQLIFPMVGIWGIMELLKKETDKAQLWKQLKIAAGITAGLCIALALGSNLFFDFTNPEKDQQYQQILKFLKEDRASLAMKSSLRSALFILAAAGIFWAYLKSKVNINTFIAVLVFLIAADLIPVSANYLNEKHYEEGSDLESTAFRPRPVDEQIMQDPDPYYRVLDITRNTYNDAIQAYFHKCVGGYSPAKLEIYQDLIEVHMSRQFNREVLNMLNTKYIIFPGGPNGQPAVQRMPETCGNAWFVEEVKWVATADEEILSLKAPSLGVTDTGAEPADNFNPRKTVVIREAQKKELEGYQFGKDSNASVTLTRYGLNELTFSSNNTQDGLAVFSDIYYPNGWKAYVDGKETPILRANYVLRTIKIPAGTHEIKFVFHPDSYYTGNRIALFSSLLLIGLCITALIMTFRGSKMPETSES